MKKNNDSTQISNVGSEKYTTEIQQIDLNTSHGIIINQIVPGSTILECGSAAGYMTKWMKENLGCHVSIIEIDKQCYDEARIYAENGFCGDLQGKEWFEYYSEMKFDYILFADVLEHLSNPQEVLTRAVKLLKNNGKVIISIPNIAHNDIVVKLWNNHFDYTDTGLLDNTHVHFWAKNNIKELVDQSGLGIVTVNTVAIPLGKTEQFIDNQLSTNKWLMMSLSEREQGEIYQYIITAQKKEYIKNNKIIVRDELFNETKAKKDLVNVYRFYSSLFWSKNESFDSNAVATRESISFGFNNKTQVCLEYEIPFHCKMLRFDPCEGFFCMITGLELSIGNQPINPYYTNGIHISDSYIFNNTDPQIIYILPEDYTKNNVIIAFSLKAFDHIDESVVNSFIQSYLNEKKLTSELIELKEEKESREAELKSTVQCCVFFEGNNIEKSKESEILKQGYNLLDNSPILFQESIAIPSGCNRIQFAPLTGKPCSIHDIYVIYDGKLLTCDWNNGKEIGKEIFFSTDNPQMCFSLPDEDGKTLYISFGISLYNTKDHLFVEMMNYINKQEKEYKETTEEKEDQIRILTAELKETTEQKENQIRTLTAELKETTEQKEDQIRTLTAELKEITEEKEDQIQTLTAELEQNKKACSEYKVTTEEKEDQIQILTAELEQNKTNFSLLQNRYHETEAKYNEISTAFFWKISALPRKMLDHIKEAKRNKTNNHNLSQDGTTYIKPTFSYEAEEDFTEYSSDIKVIALYLPQYHTFPENDKWWGKGFTEWTNVRKGISRFEDHYQPRVPNKDIGYYDLSDPKTMAKQIALAKRHGVYGFGIYYYWFSGKQLMHEPMDNLLRDKSLNIPFFLVWANENWTRTWDGKANNILIQQNYEEEDPYNFIKDTKKYFIDERYIRVDGKPVLGFYAPKNVPNVRDIIGKWREAAKSLGIGDIIIWICDSNATAADLMISDVIDGEYEFPPQLKGFVSTINRPNGGVSYNYRELVEAERHFCAPIWGFNTFRGSTMDWDNSARRKNNYFCWHDFTPELFYLWNRINVGYTRNCFPEDKRFIFVNAWNEWGEGTYLEPDADRGYANINALSRALFDIPYNSNGIVDKRSNKTILPIGTGIADRLSNEWKKKLKKRTKIAVQAHVFYEDLIDEVIDKTNNISYPFDLYISTDSQEKKTFIEKKLAKKSKASKRQVKIFMNKGRDVMPFILQLQPVYKQYEYICHIHTKKSLHNDVGTIWRDYLYENLLGSKGIVDEILHVFETRQDIGVVFPQNIDLMDSCIEWGSNKEIAETLLKKMKVSIDLPESDHIMFVAGDMFDLSLSERDFPEENAQIDGTIMHAIERLWLYLAAGNGYDYQLIRSLFDSRPLM